MIYYRFRSTDESQIIIINPVKLFYSESAVHLSTKNSTTLSRDLRTWNEKADIIKAINFRFCEYAIK